MKTNTKARIRLSSEEMNLVMALQAKLEARSKIEVIRRGLRLLEATTDRESQREAYWRASLATRVSATLELAELDHLAAEGFDGA